MATRRRSALRWLRGALVATACSAAALGAAALPAPTAGGLERPAAPDDSTASTAATTTVPITASSTNTTTASGSTTPDTGADTVPPDTVPDTTPDNSGVDGSGGESDDVVTTGDTVTRESSQPSVSTSEIPTGSIILAVLVLAGGVVVVARWRGSELVGLVPHPDQGRPGGSPSSVTRSPPIVASRRTDGSASDTASDSGARTAIDTVTLDFLLELGEGLIDAGDAVHNVTGTLQAIATVNGIANLGAIVLPTALILSVPGADDVTTEVSVAGTAKLRLDQVEALIDVAQRAERGDLNPVDGRRALTEIRERPPAFLPIVQVVGSAVAAGGLALILRGGWPEVPIAAVLGGLVGLLNRLTARRRYLYRPFWPLLASFVASATTFAALRATDLIAFPTLVAPLITFLPGALLTIAVLELATGQIIAGASRLAAGVFQLILLALGIVAGARFVGVPADSVGSEPEGPIAVAGPWVGVAVFGLGVSWSQGLRRTSWVWIVVVLYAAYAGQVVGGLFFGGELSSFFGAAAMTPIAVLLARLGLGPPTLVTFLPAFWMLVPGALGLEGVTRIIGDDRITGTAPLTATVTSMVGIALGILLGLALSAPDPSRPWTASDRPNIPWRRRSAT
ncbi:MAG: threonine/serine exporter family protein [Actinomycetota bacterium]